MARGELRTPACSSSRRSATLELVSARPPIWIGHARLTVQDLERSVEFWRSLGMREVARNEQIAVLELRGGTHLVLLPGSPEHDPDPSFDLMVEDLDAIHDDWAGRGLDVSSIEHGRIHSAFVISDPDGYRITVNSSHVVGEV